MIPIIPKRRMEKNKYLSKYSNGKIVSAAQYITELICENKANKDKLDLHYRFWVTKSWALYYRNQIATANKLLLKYDAKAIINALKDSRASKIYSLRAPHLPAIIEEKQRLLEQENKTLSLEIERTEQKTYRQYQQNKNIFSKLKDIDNGS
jgi:hypothetical protein